MVKAVWDDGSDGTSSGDGQERQHQETLTVRLWSDAQMCAME